MKRPLIALTITILFTVFVVMVVRGRESAPTDSPLQVSLIDLTPTLTTPATATAAPTLLPTVTATATATTLASLPPRLVQFQPANGVITSRFQTITLTFNQNMDQASVAAAITISPTSAFHLTWPTTKSVIISLTVPWPAGADLNLNLDTTTHNEVGRPVAAAISKPFHP
ncbi:MAG: Ig-like domain-containing protein [Chloroflexi bacterium]|nr:Ig-like domain-containing protein [Chloroflexota bacterium]